jgi:hypothetical protein
VRASETRAKGARRMRNVVYANVAASPITRIENVSGDNLIGSPVHDVDGTSKLGR